jgi:hypothetical protein
MIRVQAIKDFTLSRYDEIKNLKPRTIRKEGKIYTNDIFECSIDLAKYLCGENDKNIVAVRVLEVKVD